MIDKTWSDDMGEISGFGGGYEACCRVMVLAGIRWLDEHPDADPIFKGYEGVFGLITEVNKDAEALIEAIMDAEVTVNGKPERARKSATGAMHQAAVWHCLAYKRLGWQKYCQTLRERPQD